MSFALVDRAPEPESLVRYLEAADAEPAIRRYKERLLEALGPLSGRTVLDIGCGRGTDLLALAERVGAQGRVVGVDVSERMLAAARAQRSGMCGAVIELVCSDGAALPFESESVDVVRIDRVLVHVPSPAAVLAEARRVLRPGGRLVVAEGDYGTLMLDHPDAELTERILAVWPELFAHGRIGRALPRLVGAAGFVDVEAEVVGLSFCEGRFAEGFLGLAEGLRAAVARGAVDAMQAALWWLELERERAAGRFFASLSGVGTFARRP